MPERAASSSPTVTGWRSPSTAATSSSATASAGTAANADCPVLSESSSSVTPVTSAWKPFVGAPTPASPCCRSTLMDAFLLTVSAPGKDDPRLRRAQAAAPNAPVGLEITRALLGAKLAGQTTVAEDLLHNPPIADTISRLAEQLDSANTLPACRDLEAQASNAYFGAWTASVTCCCAERDRDRVPDHWQVFSGRGSQLRRGGRRRPASGPARGR